MVKQKNSPENNLAICVKNIKHTHNFYIKLHAHSSLVRNYSKVRGRDGSRVSSYMEGAHSLGVSYKRKKAPSLSDNQGVSNWLWHPYHSNSVQPMKVELGSGAGFTSWAPLPPAGLETTQGRWTRGQSNLPY